MGTTPRQIIDQTAARFGIPAWIPLDIAQVESGLNPKQTHIDSQEQSYGLFQENRLGGLGAPFSPAQLLNPQFNATLAIETMAPAYREGIRQGLTGLPLLDFTANMSGWPNSDGPNAVLNQPYDAALQVAYETNGASLAVGSHPSVNTTVSKGQTITEKLQASVFNHETAYPLVNAFAWLQDRMTVQGSSNNLWSFLSLSFESGLYNNGLISQNPYFSGKHSNGQAISLRVALVLIGLLILALSLRSLLGVTTEKSLLSQEDIQRLGSI